MTDRQISIEVAKLQGKDLANRRCFCDEYLKNM